MSTEDTTSVTALETAGDPHPLVSEQGTTTISEVVVAKVAGLAAREIAGVHELGGSTARAVGAVRERIPGAKPSHTQGVSVEVGERQAAVDLDIVAEYGVALADMAIAVRENVIASVERMTGLGVIEVNIVVHDVVTETDDDEDPGRVQ
ncbi:Asp23/Gls24 family envelope stress response protein [Nocardioides acrostichi]|uniref:Asp23/Gls24 family envelope stress response protein n=1 Tax=Nocardioides acrostichi TaxID=2784339 RepID=A0A930UVL0_9ACTN|nr:Asp23/Gls24 family envelope stress response protein [Nocardioides acrostichi]MBF4161658.1 Asp23/Gls24 family envelope stress response protein [Nocardioides acrostichi]